MPVEREDESRFNVRREPTGDRATGQEPDRPQGEDELAEEREEVRRETIERHGVEGYPPAGQGPVPKD